MSSRATSSDLEPEGFHSLAELRDRVFPGQAEPDLSDGPEEQVRIDHAHGVPIRTGLVPEMLRIAKEELEGSSSADMSKQDQKSRSKRR
jgi:hypothetical protein